MNSRKLRNPQDWNVGFLKAFALPDGPFKLYVWLRLNAHIETGALETSQSELSRILNKARGTIRANLMTLERAQVCRMKFPRNPHGRGWIQIMDDYWPYERGASTRKDPEFRSYLDQIRKMASGRACIRKPLSLADEMVARHWHDQGITIEHISQALLMGCARKYVSWRNGAPRVPIGNLAYFKPILGEVRDNNAPPEDWRFIRDRIERRETLRVGSKDSDRTAGAGPPEKAQKGG
jgi:hypothetical protein